ncbi:MAG: PQQ-binding-like beta-propeller repeat protein [Bryobacterales bacterium]|nr:PQQ-binding-like beta-propeller repeat protein [Bryobacterales bacterium]
MFWLRTLLAALLACAAPAADWPQFRGPAGTGIADDSPLPVEFGEGENLDWKTAVPHGHSSPVIAGDRIFMTAYEGERLLVMAVDRGSGEIEWIREAPRPRREHFQPTHGPASPSPVTDGENVYVFFGDFGALSYDAEGNERWRHAMGPFINQNGHGSSPILADGKLLIVCDQQVGSYLIALDPGTGETVWKTDRPATARGYGTAGVFRPEGGRPQVVVPGAYRVSAYDLETGEELWWVRGFAWQLKCVPLFDGDTVYINGWEIGGDPGQQQQTPTFASVLAEHDKDGDGLLSHAEAPNERLRQARPWSEADLGGDGKLDERDWQFYAARRAPINNLVAIRPGSLRGDITESGVLWRYTKSLPNTPSPLLYRGLVYLVKDGGIFSSVDPQKGASLKVGRLREAIDKYWASPVAGDGKIFVVSEGCTISTIEPGGQWSVVATSQLDGTCFATPAIVDGRVYVRSLQALYSFHAP